MTEYRARRATAETFQLAEGPVWDAEADRLLWVDIPAGEVLTGLLEGDSISVTGRRAFGESVGAVLPADDGRLAVLGRQHVLLAADDGSVVAGPAVVPDPARSRTNDAAVDPGGRLLVGTHPLEGADGPEALVQVTGERVRLLDDDLLLSNGLCWSPDGGSFYSIDTLTSTVWVRDYDVVTGETGPRRVHLGPADLPGPMPDGMCCDTDGLLWIAFWGDGAVHRIAGDGTVVDTVRVDAPHTTSMAFAGPGLSTLVITTAREDLTDSRLAAAPGSGALFTVELTARGLPQERYRLG
jgi:sugar lactone lactonase YvrE